MSSFSRREFCKIAGTQAAALGLLTTGALKLRANPLGMPIGCQTWPVRDLIAKDFPGTLKQLAAAGFKSIELCSPVGYSDNGFGGLAKYKGSELKQMISDAGLSCVSSHFGIDELRKKSGRPHRMGERRRPHANACTSLDGPKTPTMDDVKRAADEYNKMGERAAQAGIQQGLHNESSSFPRSMVSAPTMYSSSFSIRSW